MLQAILRYFPSLTSTQISQYQQITSLYMEWNTKINVISRKDTSHFYIHHVLHSLSIAKFVDFKDGTQVMDLGTGGGFPAVPLAIMFPKVHFLAVDSIQKKLLVIDDISEKLNLKNIKTHWGRAEDIKERFDFVVTRAVAPLDQLLYWTRQLTHPISFNDRDNGLIALKGGDLKEEIKASNRKATIISLADFFSEDFFETKSIVYVKGK